MALNSANKVNRGGAGHTWTDDPAPGRGAREPATPQAPSAGATSGHAARRACYAYDHFPTAPLRAGKNGAAGELLGALVIEELVPHHDSVLIIRYAGPVRTWRPSSGELLTMPSGTE